MCTLLAFDYLKMTMQGLSNILYNTTQSNSVHNSKDEILNSIKRMILDYNNKVDNKNKVNCVDFRKGIN